MSHAYYNPHGDSMEGGGKPGSEIVLVTEGAKPRPDSHLFLSIFTCCCCNCILGIVAIVFSVLSRQSDDLPKAENYGRISLWVNVAALALGLLCILVGAILIFMYWGVINDATNTYTPGAEKDCWGYWEGRDWIDGCPPS